MQNFGLYPVITEEFCNGRSSIYVLKAILKAGVKIVQLREKNKTKCEILKLALKYRELTDKHNVKLIINDHIDIALSVNADGIHLGQDDLPCSEARKISKKLLIGVSTHSKKEITKAIKDGASYINIGPIFETKTKTLSIKPLGINLLKNLKINIPFSVMGGIKKHHIHELKQYGVKNIAMVTEITKASNITSKVKELNKIIQL